MLLSGKTFFLSSRNDFAILNKGGGTVMIKGRDTEYRRHFKTGYR
jgi:hypothetical protein